jgi:hypothetical protein
VRLFEGLRILQRRSTERGFSLVCWPYGHLIPVSRFNKAYLHLESAKHGTVGALAELLGPGTRFRGADRFIVFWSARISEPHEGIGQDIRHEPILWIIASLRH